MVTSILLIFFFDEINRYVFIFNQIVNSLVIIFLMCDVLLILTVLQKVFDLNKKID